MNVLENIISSPHKWGKSVFPNLETSNHGLAELSYRPKGRKPKISYTKNYQSVHFWMLFLVSVLKRMLSIIIYRKEKYYYEYRKC